MNLKGALLALVLVVSAFAHAQRPILLTGPDAQGVSLNASLDAARTAAAHGYNGVSVGIGLRRMTDPDKINLSGIRSLTREAMKLKLKYVCFRLDSEIPVNQLWADKYNGGQLWPIATRPPKGTWIRIAEIWQKVQNISADECTRWSVDPTKALIFVLSNEPGMGGVGGPSLGPWSSVSKHYTNYLKTGDTSEFLKAFPEWLLGKPEGYIDPGFWTMLRNLRGRCYFKGSRVYAVSYEAFENAIPGQVDSTVGADAEAIFAGATGFAFNLFAPSARARIDSVTGEVLQPDLSPEEAALAYRARLDNVVQMLRSGPILSTERVLWTEANLTIHRIPVGADPYTYWMPMLRMIMSYPGLDGSAIYLAFQTSDNSGYNHFTRYVVDGVSQIQPVGSHAVGPAYLNVSLRSYATP